MHLIQVHRSWATIVEERAQDRPDDEQDSDGGPSDHFVGTFTAGAVRLIGVLRAADPTETVWTWAPARHDVAFIVRQQVQEAAIHHWDAVDAAGGSLTVSAPIAVDAITHFLSYGVSNPASPWGETPLDGSFSLRCRDVDAGWKVRDGEIPGTLQCQPEVNPSEPAVEATASDLLLWLYNRVNLETTPVDPDLIERFRSLCSSE